MDFFDSIIEKVLAGAVEYVRIKLLRNGLNEVTLKKWTKEHKSTNPEMFSYRTAVKSLTIIGLADFEVKKFKFNFNDVCADFDLLVPEIVFSFDDVIGNLKYLLSSADGLLRGRIVVKEPRISGKAYFRQEFGGDDHEIFSKVDIFFNIQHIKAELMVIINGKDYSDTFNHFLNKTVPELIRKNRTTASCIITHIIQTLVKYVLRSDNSSDDSNSSDIPDFLLAMLKSASGLPPEIVNLFVALSQLKIED